MVDLPSVKQSFTITTTSELKSRAIKSSMGVLPLRRSESIPELNLVHLRGRSVMGAGEANEEFTSTRVAANTPMTPKQSLTLTESNKINIADRREPLPAILPMVGTTHAAALQERQPANKPIIQRPPIKRRKVDIVVIEHEPLERSTPRSIVNRMVNEARLLTQPAPERITPHSRLSSKQQSYGTTSSMSLSQQQTLSPADDPTRAAVENLISSIKSKQLQEAQRQSDRKILDIIHRVLGRTVDLVYDEDEQDKTHQDHDQQLTTDQIKIPMITEEEDLTLTPRAPDVSRMDVEIDLEKDEDEHDEQDILVREKTIDTIQTIDQDENIDMSRDPLYRHILLGITHEDVLNVRGTHIDVPTPLIPKTQSLQPKPKKHDEKSVHHFCIQMADDKDILPKEIRAITQLYHEQTKYRHRLPRSATYHKHGQLPSYPPKVAYDDDDQQPIQQKMADPIKTTTPSIPFNGLLSLDTDLSIWQRRATELVQPKIEGNSALSHDPYLIHLWTPAPPKMFIHPRRVKQRLFAEYTSVHTKGLSDDEDENLTATGEHETIYTNFSEQDSFLDSRFLVPVIKPYKSLERLPSTIDHSDEFQLLPRMLRATRSLENLTGESVLRFDTNYALTLDETKHQIKARKAFQNEQITPTPPPTAVDQQIQTIAPETTEIPQVQEESTADEKSQEFKYFPKTKRLAVYEQAVANDQRYISNNRLRAARRARKDEHFWQRIDAIVAIATAPPRTTPLERRHSFHEALFYEQNHPHIIKERFRQRRVSLQRDKQNFDNTVKPKYKYDETRTKSAGKRLLNEFEWTRELWYQWLDEYIAELDKQETVRQDKERKKQQSMMSSPIQPPSRTTMIDDEDEDDEDVVDETGERISKKSSTIPKEPIINLHLPDSEERRMIENEIYRLTDIINQNPRDAFSLSRRGGLFRKLGLFHDALNDLSLAVYIEPSFMDAYWQRALIYMIFEHYDDALESLNACIKLNRNHAGAYKLRGDIYLVKNDLALAIANYSQAIRHNPTDHEAFFQRAQTYERRNEILLAMDDYLQVTKLNPRNIEAWHRHAMYYFNTNNYENAIIDFTELLKRQMDHVSARLHRGLSYFHLEYYQAALTDFSATLHYDPSNWAAYYHRACLLRTCNPNQALKDYSISLLINCEYENIGAYLHRALIYCKQNRFDEAIADYEAVLVLDREHAPALCNLAIIYMRTNIQKALQLFSRAIQAEPTYVRAYFCRAYFHSKLNQFQEAYSDYTKIYHMFPDQNGAMVLRGNMLLAMGKLDLASFCVEVAAKLQSLSSPEEDDTPTVSSTSSVMKMNASSPQQQAIVHSFLEQYDHALGIMERECSYHPIASNYRMLGTLRMKAKRFDEARDAFEKCIHVCLPNQTAELHGAYLDLSKCLIQLKRYAQAIDKLTTLLKIQQSNQSAEAYLQRGIAKMRMYAKSSAQELAKLSSNRRPLLDINKALVIKPNNAEAYLARAAWYARCERFSKGVLNCNEAIRLSPNLVRAYLYRGCLKYSLRLYDHAINDLTKALEIDPSCSHAYYNRALCYIRRGNLSYAFKDFAIVLCLATATITNLKTQLLEFETYINRGLLHFEHKDFQNALVDFEHALDLVLKSGDEKKIHTLKHKLIYTIGQCHHRLAQFNHAIEQLTSMEIHDRSLYDTTFRHDLWIAQGSVYMDIATEKSQIKATRLFERVLHENPLHEQARLNLGYCLRQRGLYQRAWIQFSALLQFNRTNVRALEARAVVCLQMNHPTEAFIDLNQALRYQPSSAQLLTNRGVVQQYLGDNKNAMSDYRAAMLADPQNSFAHYNAGNILMFHGQFSQAVTLFDRVVEINPRDEAALTNRAIAKAVLKQYTSAQQDLEQALRISPLSAHIHIDLGQLLLTMDKPMEAEEHFTRALEIRPCDPVVYKWRGDARAKQEGRREDALEDYRTCVELNDALLLARKHGLIKPPIKTRRKL